MLNFWVRDNNALLDESRNRGVTSRVYGYFPSETVCTGPGCGWDSFSQSAKRTGCPVCHGTGKVTTWSSWTFLARVLWTSGIKLNPYAPSTGIELGDMILTVSSHDRAMMERIQGNERAYLQLDGKTIRPSAIQRIDVPTIGEECQVVCNLYSPSI